MDYEKMYKDALAKAREIHRNEDEKKFDMEWLFPELTESEDEKMVKAIIKALQSHSNSYNKLSSNGIQMEDAIAWLNRQVPTKISEEDEKIRKEILSLIQYTKGRRIGYEPRIHQDEMLAWLEKQGQQKPTEVRTIGYWQVEDAEQKPTSDIRYDGVNAGASRSVVDGKPFDYEHATITQKDFAPKIEPKFKVGKWYQCAKDFFGKGVTFDKNTAYYCAKEGCLQNEYGCHIAIVKDLYDNFKLWTIQDAKDGDVLTNGELILIFKQFEEPTYRQHIIAYVGLDTNGNIQITDDTWNLGIDKAKPATKEQRELLFKKMNEAGYEWNADKKELKLLITNGGDFEQKQEWSEEDESYINNAIAACRSLYGEYSETAHWLKSLKDRMKG